jgi:phosphohistidine phosphatase
MKRLAILRHAKSSWENPAIGDFDRPLNERGWKESRRLGRELKTRGIDFDLCVASTAQRVRETLDGLSKGYGSPDFEIRFEQRIYEASLATLMDIVRGFPDSAQRPLLVGHNPGLHQLALELADEDSKGLREHPSFKFPTAALAVLDIHEDRWADVRPGCGEISELIFPRELD